MLITTIVPLTLGKILVSPGLKQVGQQQGNQDSKGKGDFYYEPPTDSLALCSDNLSRHQRLRCRVRILIQ